MNKIAKNGRLRTIETEIYQKQLCVFANNLIYYIERTGRSQREIADILGVPQPTLNSWCRGKKFPRIDKLEKLATYFGVEIEALTGEKTDSDGCKISPAKQELMELALSCSEDEAKDLLTLAQIFLKNK